MVSEEPISVRRPHSRRGFDEVDSRGLGGTDYAACFTETTRWVPRPLRSKGWGLPSALEGVISPPFL